MRFEFASAQRIVFALGAVADLPALVREYGRKPLLVTGRDTTRASRAVDGLLFPVAGEPSVEIVRRGALTAREQGCDVVIGFGGGSAIDAAKAIAALASNSGDVLDYLEVVGRGRPLEHRPLPFIAVPTTAGTGSEVTRNAVIASPEHGVKASLRSLLMLARIAVVDPELTLSAPPAITASTGMDALTQLIEPYVSSRANAMTDLFCREGMRRVAQALAAAVSNGQDRAARESMSYASLLGGLALANAGLGVVHGFAAPIGGMFDAAHGAICAALLPHGMAVNIQALRRRAPDHPALERYREIARILTGDPEASADDGIGWVADLARQIGIRPLAELGVDARKGPELVEKAAAASSMKANPIVLTKEELRAVLERS